MFVSLPFSLFFLIFCKTRARATPQSHHTWISAISARFLARVLLRPGLIDKHFPLQHKLHKIFNRNTLKVSYSCMNNVKSIITKHNAHITRNSQTQTTETDNCNCDNKNTCPLPKQCMTNNIIYKATVTTNNTNDTS
jgi:hypothetical protein